MTLNQSEDSDHFVPGEHGLSSVSSFPIPRKVTAVGRACAPPPSPGPPWPFFFFGSRQAALGSPQEGPSSLSTLPPRHGECSTDGGSARAAASPSLGELQHPECLRSRSIHLTAWGQGWWAAPTRMQRFPFDFILDMSPAHMFPSKSWP